MGLNRRVLCRIEGTLLGYFTVQADDDVNLSVI